jgi:hypothetical protein
MGTRYARRSARGWKVTIEHAGKKTDFYSSPNFESLDKRAQDKAG